MESEDVAAFGRGKHAVIYRDMHQGDTPERHRERMRIWDDDADRRISTVDMVTRLHDQLGTMTRAQAAAGRSTAGLPSMLVRTIGNKLFGTATGNHCHAGIYRSRGAMEAMMAGGLDHRRDAIVHCEHTIPGNVVVDQLWLLRQSGALAEPRQTLQWIFDNTVVTVMLKADTRRTPGATVYLNRRRSFDGVESGWAKRHPDLTDGRLVTDATRPFRRYVGTGAEVMQWPEAIAVDMEAYTIADHKAYIAENPVLRSERYFPAALDLAA